MKKRWIIVLLILGLIVGCVAKPQPAPVVQKNPRIIERDLSQARVPIIRPVAVAVAPESIKEPKIETPAVLEVVADQKQNEVAFEIEFANDSHTQLLESGKTTLEQIKEQIEGSSSIVCIGYSNGLTAVGNAKLASSRADYVAAQLQKFGVSRDKIKTRAEWGPKFTVDIPAKGVQVLLQKEVLGETTTS